MKPEIDIRSRIAGLAGTGKGTLTEFESKQLLRSSGISVPQGEICSSPDEALEAAKRIGWPVVAKISSREISHKSDAGGVCTGIASDAALLAALEEMKRRTGIEKPEWLIEQELIPAMELIIGVIRDPVFGPVCMIGMGGIFTEILSDKLILLPPLDRDYIVEGLKGLRGSGMLFGARGRKPVDLDALIKTVRALFETVGAEPAITEIEINPLFLSDKGAWAADALVALARQEGERKTGRADYAADVSPFFEAGSIAVIGASSSPRKGGNIIVKNLLTFGYKGKIFPVNPRGSDVCGLKSFKSIAELPSAPELAVFVIPNTAVSKELDACIALGVRNVIIASGGFSDQGPEGAAIESGIIEKARGAGVRVLGPNSIGTITPSNGLVTSITTLHRLQPGNIALFGQTGVFASGTADIAATRERYRLSRIACIGNKADINEIHLLNFFARDGKSSVIAAYLEGTSDGPQFIEAVKTAAAAKPLIILKGGSGAAGQAATASHTGTMAGSFEIYRAIFKRYGVTMAEDFPDLLETAKAFSFCPLPAGKRLGVVSITGIGCVLSADASDEYGVELPPLAASTLSRIREIAPPWAPLRNPVDMWSAIEKEGGAAAYRHISKALIEQEDIDALLLIFVLIPESDFDPGEVIVPLRREHPSTPILAACLGGHPDVVDKFTSVLEENGIPMFASPRCAIRAFARMAEYARFRSGRSASR